MKSKDGGSAFPDHIDLRNAEIEDFHGMSIRDYFAGEALAGIVKHDLETLEESNGMDEEQSAFMAYKYADAMLAERDKE